MKKITLLSLFLGFAMVAFSNGNPAADMTKKEVNIEKSTVIWKADKVIGSGHEGTVNLKSGSLKYDAAGMLAGGMFTIDMTSIKTTDLSGNMAAKLEGHLKSDDFFGVETFPTADFEITTVDVTDKGTTISGNLTIKGKTHPVSFEARMSETGAAAIIQVDRTLYDVRYGSGKFFDNLGDKTIKDIFDLEVSLVFAGDQ